MGTNKKRYIELYGEEAWEIERQKRNRKKKQLYQDNKEKIKTSQKKYYEENREKIKTRQRKYNNENREERNLKGRLYYQNNKQQINEKSLQYYQTNKERLLNRAKQYHQKNKEKDNARCKHYYHNHLEYSRQYNHTPKGRARTMISNYRKTDIAKSQECDLTSKWIIENIFTSKCYYCGDSDWTHLGCDRIDNTKGHTMDNCICACGICNIERSDRYTVEEFKQYRQLHPRGCDIPKTPLLNEKGCLVKKQVPSYLR